MAGKNVPAIRFAGFDNIWEGAKLSNLADRYDNFRIPVAASQRIAGNTPYYGANGILDYVDGYTHDGEFILVAEDGANNLKNYPVQFVSGKIWVNNHAHVLQEKKNISNNLFLKYSISCSDIESILVGGTRAKLTSLNMMDIFLRYPELSEQKLIGKFYYHIDSIIDFNQQKLTKLQNFKQAMLEKMFPKPGETVPEVRFKGFSGEWYSCNLQDEADNIETGKSKFTIKSSGQYKILGSTSVIGYDDSYDYEGNFLLTARVGANAGDLYRHSGKVKISDNTVFIKGENLNYIYYVLTKFDIKKLSFGTGQHLVKASELKKIQIQSPRDIKEKNLISNFFVNIDNSIKLTKQKLAKIKNIKQALLNKMFV